MSATQTFPILLAHGIARFDILRETLIQTIHLDEDKIDDNFQYFRGIRDFLIAHHFHVHHASVGFADSVDKRADKLSQDVDQVLQAEQAAKVHIIAHSMGGLDARHMIIGIDGMAEKVASLTTIGTPHLGTPFANAGLEFGGTLLIKLLSPVLNLDGFKDLTVDACQAFNDQAIDKEAANGVAYQTYAGAEDQDSIFSPLLPSWRIVNRKEGENDGLVSITSQAWVEKLVSKDGKCEKIVEQHRFPVPVDHLNEVGWWDIDELNEIGDLQTLKQRAEEYEAQIKNVNLEIASNLNNLIANNDKTRRCSS